MKGQEPIDYEHIEQHEYRLTLCRKLKTLAGLNLLSLEDLDGEWMDYLVAYEQEINAWQPSRPEQEE